MKPIFNNLVLLVLVLILTSLEPILKKSQLIGSWKMVSAKNNGVSAPEAFTNRRQIFGKDKTFASQLNTANGLRPFNDGVYFLPNDTTVMTFHKELNGKLSTIANTYFFRIKNDSLHLYGYYLGAIRENPALLQKVFIDERWVRIKAK